MHNYDNLYKKLMNCNWLEKCGNRENIFDKFGYIWAESLSEAEEKINSVKWENVVNEEKNLIWAFLTENCPAAF